MPTAETLRALLALVEEAKGPDRALDEAIMGALYVLEWRHMGEKEDSGPNGEWVPVESLLWIDKRTDKWVTNHAFRFTEEARDTDRLVGFLPGGWQVSTMTPDPTRPGTSGHAWAKVQPFQTNDAGWMIGARDCTAPTVALAVTQACLMALLSGALLQQSETSHVER